MIQIYNDFFTEEESNVFLNLLDKCEIPLFFSPTTTGGAENLEDETPQFTHLFYQDNTPSFLYDTWFNIFQKIPEVSSRPLIRAKLNLQTTSGRDLIHPPHNDGDAGSTSFLYYLNDSDGPTVFYTGKKPEKVYPKKNRLVRFPANLLHSSSTPNKSMFRAVINIVVK